MLQIEQGAFPTVAKEMSGASGVETALRSRFKAADAMVEASIPERSDVNNGQVLANGGLENICGHVGRKGNDAFSRPCSWQAAGRTFQHLSSSTTTCSLEFRFGER